MFHRLFRSRKHGRPATQFTLPARWNISFLQLERLDDRIVPSFSPAVNYAVGTDPNAVVAGDFNNDGVDDLATANWGNQTVSVLLGNGDGTFDPAFSSAAGNSPTSLAAGDFNGDGKLDLAAGDPAAGSTADVTVLIGNGDGTYRAPAAININIDDGGYLSPYGVESVAVGDFNGDRKLDICAVTHSASVGYYGDLASYGLAAVLLGTGTGTFGSPLWSSTGYGHNTDTTFADFNADGKLDIASVSDYGDINVAQGFGNGKFDSPNTYYNHGAIPFAVAAADLNADGKLDLATANYASGTVSVLLGTGTGTFGSPASYAAGSSPNSAAAADFNGDGVIDLIATDAQTATVNVLLGTGTGAFRPAVPAAVGSTPLDVVVGDFNGDGKMDAASANSSSDNVSVLLNDGTWPALDSPSLAINDVTVTEGNTGTVNATFTVTLSAASSQTVTVHYATMDGSATVSGGDYQSANGTVTFAPGETTKTITVLVNGDRVGESSEYFLLVLTDPTNAFVADTKGVGNITDDEPRASIDYGPVYVTEGNTGTTDAVFTIRLSNAWDQPVSVDYATANGTANAGSDYQAANGTVTFAPGETVKTVSVPVIGDRVTESNETFSVLLSSPSSNAVLSSSYSSAVIRDDEPRISLSPGYLAITEGDAGTTDAVFTVSLSAAYDQDVTVDYATSDDGANAPDSAIAGSDYLATAGTLRFTPGQTSQTIRVPVIGDQVSEWDEYFYLNLDNASSNAVLSSSSAVGVILNDEPPEIRIYDVTQKEGNTGTFSVTFTVGLSFASTQAVSVNYATASGSATAGSDYYATSGTLTFAPGQTSQYVTVAVIGDRLPEANETFFVNLSSPTNATIADGLGVGTIVDDEPRISISDVTKSEGRKGKTTLFTFTVTLSAAYDQPVTMSFRTVDGTAKASDGDYVAKTGTITFNPGETSKTITIIVTGDNKKESNETFYLDLFGNSSNSLITKSRGVGTILNDD